MNSGVPVCQHYRLDRPGSVRASSPVAAPGWCSDGGRRGHRDGKIAHDATMKGDHSDGVRTICMLAQRDFNALHACRTPTCVRASAGATRRRANHPWSSVLKTYLKNYAAGKRYTQRSIHMMINEVESTRNEERTDNSLRGTQLTLDSYSEL
jgi:hypothetical protein